MLWSAWSVTLDAAYCVDRTCAKFCEFVRSFIAVFESATTTPTDKSRNIIARIRTAPRSSRACGGRQCATSRSDLLRQSDILDWDWGVFIEVITL
jgi:hypothetical protein